MARLEVRRLTKSFGGNRALQDVGFLLSPGELVSVIGPNGAGKTTLLDAISGLIKPDRGNVLVDGADISAVSPWKRSGHWLDRTFQQIKLTASLTVEENVMRHVRGQRGIGLLAAVLRRNKWAEEEKRLRTRAEQALASFDLEDLLGRRPPQLSFGQKKMVSLCGVSISEMPILLLDEPFTGLDTRRLGQVSAWLKQESRKGQIILFVEHNLKAVAETASRVLALDRGQLIGDGAPEEILESDRLKKAYLR